MIYLIKWDIENNIGDFVKGLDISRKAKANLLNKSLILELENINEEYIRKDLIVIPDHKEEYKNTLVKGMKETYLTITNEEAVELFNSLEMLETYKKNENNNYIKTEYTNSFIYDKQVIDVTKNQLKLKQVYDLIDRYNNDIDFIMFENIDGEFIKVGNKHLENLNMRHFFHENYSIVMNHILSNNGKLYLTTTEFKEEDLEIVENITISKKINKEVLNIEQELKLQ